MSIWYDVSALYNWRGHFTGIQRAVFNIGKSLSVEDDTAHFFIFQHGSFQEISFATLESRLSDQTKTKTVAGVPQEKVTLAKLQHHGMIAAKQMVIGSRFEGPLRKTYGGLRNTYRGIRPRNISEAKRWPFGPDDIVVVVDGNWQFGGYDKALISAKTKTGFHLVHFVHDLTAVRNPALVNRGAEKIIGGYFERLFPYADKLLAISESTKRDVEWFSQNRNIKAPPTSVVILGSDISHENDLTPKQPSGAAAGCVLAVSTIEVRKNYLLLYYAYKQAARQSITLPKLVIVGRKGWMAEETYNLLTEDPEIRDHIAVLSGVSDEELTWLYQNCLFTVFPSFYEGWGLPIAESLLHGKCCISTDISSMPEVGGDLVRYVSPYSPDEMIKAIKDVSDDKTRMKMESRIKAEFKPVTWQDTYETFREEVSSL